MTAKLKPTIPASYLTQLLLLCEQKGVNKGIICNAANISDSDLSSGRSLSYEQFKKLIHSAVDYTEDSRLGLSLGNNLNITDHKMLGIACLACTSIDQIFKLVITYSPALCPLFKWVTNSNEHSTTFGLIVDTEDKILGQFSNEMFVMILDRSLSYLLPDFPADVHVKFGFPEPNCIIEYQEKLNCSFIFDNPHTEIVIPHTTLEKKLPFPNPYLRQEAETHCKSLLNVAHSNLDIVNRVIVISQNIAIKNLTADSIAENLNISTRTLRRQLKQKNTSFSELLEEIKKDKAIKQIRETQQSLQGVAYELGYNDYNSFLRAFKKWTNRTPRSYREKLQLS